MIYNYGSDRPGWEHPTMDNVYIKQLDYCDKHPRCSGNELSSIGSTDIWKTLVNWGMIDRAKSLEKRRSFEFSITDEGRDLLNKAKTSKWVHDFIKFVKDTKSKTFDEFEINATLAGSHFYVEFDFLQKLAGIWKFNRDKDDNAYLAGKLKRYVKFMDVLIDKWRIMNAAKENEDLKKEVA